MVLLRPSLGVAMRGGKHRSGHGDLRASPHGEGTCSRQSGSFSCFEGVGSLEIQWGSHSDEWANAHASNLP